MREIEDEGQLDRVGGAELSVQGMGAPRRSGPPRRGGQRTVGSHLYRSFPKLGVTARSQLRDLIEGALARAGHQE
ncbi:hypothetical protein [Actinoallomurus acanthiterrae]